MTDTTTEAPPIPAERSYGLGEMIRASRLYIGISQRGMAKHLHDMDRRSYQRIEVGDDPCPVGLMDTVDQTLERFDADVEQVLSAARRGNERVSLTVPSDPREEWTRCVLSRAYVLDEDHLLVLVVE